jgi:hypothetical protein
VGIGRRCLLALGLAGAVIVGMAAMMEPAHALYPCCWNECKKWLRAPGSIGGRCVQQVRKCRDSGTKLACHGRHPN